MAGGNCSPGRSRVNKDPQAGPWWHTSVIPVTDRERQDDQEFKASLSYIPLILRLV